jgi:trehalose-6-phosphatase
MKAYMRHFLALIATVFGAQASVGDRAQAQDINDSQAWAAAQADGSRQAFEDYLAQFPVGAHAREAFARIIQLSDGDGTPLNLSDDFADDDVFRAESSTGLVPALY